LKISTGMSGAHAMLQDFFSRIQAYKEARDFPAVKGVSYLSFHNRFGTVSIRKLASLAYAQTLHKDNLGAQTWLSELIWRDFYFQILFHAPHVTHRASLAER
jgi:deoxyribodipyrimidine photo-lyase